MNDVDIVPPMSSLSPRDQIAAKAQEFDLGAPRLGTLAPIRIAGDPRRGMMQVFERGFVFWSQRTGAHLIRGTIYGAWNDAKGALGDLGHPLTDELPVPAPYAADRCQFFEGGTIYWHANRNAAVILYRIEHKNSA